MTVLKIGILTFHRCINYGSYWQARCLAEGLQARGHQVEILDHESKRVNIAEWKCAFQPVLPTAVPATDYPLYRKKINKFFSVFQTMPLSSRFPLDDPREMDTYDVVVVGSDEVWNLSHPWYSNYPLFYGEGIKAKKLISYAATFGSYHASAGLGQKWVEKLQNFDFISVRDENSQTIIRNALGFQPQMVLDPCLQFPIHADKRDTELLQHEYIAVYGHNFSEFFITEVKKFAAARQLPLISIGYRNDWADKQWLTADPHDFAHFIANASSIATNFFHGCVFSLCNAKPFACETTPYRSNKLTGLMNKVGAEKHLLTAQCPSSAYEEVLGQNPDSAIAQKIKHLQQTSNAYLDQALSENNYYLHEQTA